MIMVHGRVPDVHRAVALTPDLNKVVTGGIFYFALFSSSEVSPSHLQKTLFLFDMLKISACMDFQISKGMDSSMLLTKLALFDQDGPVNVSRSYGWHIFFSDSREYLM